MTSTNDQKWFASEAWATLLDVLASESSELAMAGSGAGTSESSDSQKTFASLSEKDQTRRVSFNKSALQKASFDRDPESPAQNEDDKERLRKSRSNMCCAWVSFAIGTFIFILLLLGVILFSFFQSNMPTFHLRSLTVNKLQFNTKGRDLLMDSDIEVALNATNRVSDIEFYYSHMTADIFSGDIFLGRVHLPELHQKPENSSTMKVHTVLKKQTVAEADALKLKTDLQNHLLVVDVFLNGIIHYKIKENKITGFPFKVSCQKMDQTSIDKQQLPCHVKMTPLT